MIFQILVKLFYQKNQNFKNELKINSFTVGADYEFSPRKHVQLELFLLGMIMENII